MFVIPPIKLLKGTHPDIGKTGTGCFMNVVAYLNGESEITDASPCVCPMVRSVVMFLNDTLDDEERQQLLPYVTRAIGSYTSDMDETDRRWRLYEEYRRQIPEAATRAAFTADSLQLLDDMLPPVSESPSEVLVARADRLAEIQQKVLYNVRNF